MIPNDEIHIIYLLVDEAFEKIKDKPWDSADGMIWPKDFLEDGWYHNRSILDDAEAGQEYLESAQAHWNTINYWVEYYRTNRLIKSKGYVLINEDESLLDGHHRLTAAKIAGRKILPAYIQQD